jgi:hypothetical protein
MGKKRERDQNADATDVAANGGAKIDQDDSSDDEVSLLCGSLSCPSY